MNEKLLLLALLGIGGGAAYYFWNKSKNTNTTTNNTTKSNTTNLAAGRNEDTDLADYKPTPFVPYKPNTSSTTVPKQADKQVENQQIVAAMQDKPVFSSDLTSVKITNVPVTSSTTKPTLLVFAPKTTTPPKVDVNNSGNSEEGCEWRGDCW